MTEGEKYPEPQDKVCEATGKQQGSVGEIPEFQEGKGKEEEGNRNGCYAALPENFPAESVSVAIASDQQIPDQTKIETELQASCRETWHAYDAAYALRYGVKPVRNAKVSSQLKQFVKRIGFAESPQVAAFFVGHANAFYIRKSHDVGSLLADAEKLRMEWATGRMVTASGAQQVDRTQSNFNAANEAIRMLEAEGVR